MPILGAILWASYRVIVGWVGARDSTETMVLYTALVGVVIFGGVAPVYWRSPSLADWGWLFCLGGLGSAAHLILIQSLTLASVVVQPFGYALTLWATVMGFLMFDEDVTVERPLVRRHPRTGRKALYFGNQVSVGVVGWTNDQARAFIRDLTEHACQPDFRYRHQWRVGDAVLWDNRRVLHAGTPYDIEHESRLMHRTTLQETEPI